MAAIGYLAVKVAKPAFKLLRVGWDRIARARMEPIYRESHEAYLRRCVPGRHWSPLGDAVEYSMCTFNDFTVEDGGEALILVRARQGVGKVRRAVIRVSTVAGRRTRQLPPIPIDEIGPVAVEAPIVGMPIERLWTTETDIVRAYDEVVVELLELRIGESHTVFDPPLRHRLIPSYWDYLNGHVERRWDQIWNLDLLASGRALFGETIRATFLDCHEDSPWRSPRTIGGVLRRLAVDRMLHARVLDSTFRSLLALGLVRLDHGAGFAWRVRVIPRSDEAGQAS